MKLFWLISVAQSLVIHQQRPMIANLDKEKSLLDIIYEHPSLTLASKLIKERPAIAKALSGSSSSLTIFVPTDEALKHVKTFPFDETTQLLLYHVVMTNFDKVDQIYESSQLTQGLLLETGLNLVTLGDRGQKIKITTEHGTFRV